MSEDNVINIKRKVMAGEAEPRDVEEQLFSQVVETLEESGYIIKMMIDIIEHLQADGDWAKDFDVHVDITLADARKMRDHVMGDQHLITGGIH